MKHCVYQWAIFLSSVICAHILGWPPFLTFIAGSIFGAATVMTAVTVSEAKP